MIDTLKLRLSDYSIGSKPDITIQPSAVNAATSEFRAEYPLWHDGSRYVLGARAYHNAENFNLSIQPMSPSEPDSVGCFVQFSVPKVATGSNYHPTDHKGTVEALKSIQKQLGAIGVKTNLKTANLSRVDTFKTVSAKEPYHSYHPVLAMLQGQRMAKRDYGTTFLWGNTQQEICVYDKLVEMQHRKCNVTGLPENSIRFEHRMLKAKKVRDTLQMRTVADLVAAPDHVRDTYCKVMEKQLFKLSIEEIEVFTASQMKNLMRATRDSGARDYFLKSVAALAIAAGVIDVEAVCKASDSEAPSRMAALRHRRIMKRLQMDAAALQPAGTSKRTLSDLYSELQRGVLSVGSDTACLN
jgi:hypothetical protein